ncbi:MAG: hypothetical protein NZM42_05880 [Gemmatales bacterium]|nr:hypothetical protein [Gemmatales bacterium]
MSQQLLSALSPDCVIGYEYDQAFEVPVLLLGNRLVKRHGGRVGVA